MQNRISYIVLALLAGASTAHAQDVITPPPTVWAPAVAVVTQPVQTVETVPVETVETVQTVRPLGHARRRSAGHRLASSRPENIVTTTTRRTILRERVVTPAPAVAAITEPMVEAPTVLAPAYPPRLYDVAAPPAVVTEPIVGAPVAGQAVGLALPAYRYVYEPDRILVIDPATGIAMQAIPR